MNDPLINPVTLGGATPSSAINPVTLGGAPPSSALEPWRDTVELEHDTLPPSAQPVAQPSQPCSHAPLAVVAEARVLIPGPVAGAAAAECGAACDAAAAACGAGAACDAEDETALLRKLVRC